MRLKKKSLKKTKETKKNGNSGQRKKNPRTFRVYFENFKLIGSLVLTITLLGVGTFSDYPSQIYHALLQGIYNKSAKIGFKLEEIVVQGRSKTEQEALLKALNIKRGDAILAIDLETLRFEIEKLEWVRSATVIRQLPNILYIKITERNPIAIWQNNQKLYLVDEDSTPIYTDSNIQNYGKLPIVVGEGAPAKTPEIVKTVKEYPKIFENLQALCRIRERRWNIFLTSGMVVKLSDENLKEGLNNLEKLLNENRITDSVKEIDLRPKDRFFVKVTPEVVTNIKNSRKGKKT
jgi:cell division protein FtsQ